MARAGEIGSRSLGGIAWSTLIWSLLLSAILLVTTVGPSSAQVVNGDFSAGATGWTSNAPTNSTLSYTGGQLTAISDDDGTGTNSRTFASQTITTVDPGFLSFLLVSYNSSDTGGWDYPTVRIGTTYYWLTTGGALTTTASAGIDNDNTGIANVSGATGIAAGSRLIGFGVTSVDSQFGPGTAVWDNIAFQQLTQSPGAQSTNEDTSLVLSGANAPRVATNSNLASMSVTVSVTNGTLTLATTTGLTVSGNGTASVTLSGSPTNINNALNGLTYAPTANYNGASTLTFQATAGSLNDTDTIAITVTPQADADLSLAKSVNVSNPPQLTNVTFSLTLTNSGPDAATGVQVTDLLPAGLSFISATPSQGTYTSGTGIWDLVTNVANGAAPTLQIVAQVTGTGSVTNVAQVTVSGTPDPDSTPNDGTGDDHDAVTLTVGAPLPAPTTTQVCSSLTGAWSGASAASGGITVTRSLSVSGGGTWDASTTNTMNTINAWSSTAVQGNPSLVDTFRWNGGPTSISGNSGTYSLSFSKPVTNPVIHLDRIGGTQSTGTSNSSKLILNSGGTLFRLAGPAHFETYSDNTIIRTLNQTTTGTESSLSSSSGTAAGSIMISGTHSSVSFTIEGHASVNEAGGDAFEVVVCAPQADLSLTKVVDNATPATGQDVTFTLTLNNSGPEDAPSVQVTDLLPAGLTFVSATPSQGTYASDTGIWDLGTVANGASPTLQIIATVIGTGTIINSAEVTASGFVDPDSTPGDGADDDFASVELTATSYSIETTKTAAVSVAAGANNTITDAGDTVTYTITIENTGGGTLASVGIASDTLTRIGGGSLALTAGPTFVSNSGASPAGTLAPGEVATFTATYQLVQADIDAGGIENTATGTGTPPSGPDVTDVSDDGNDADGNTEDDPTVTDGIQVNTLSIVKSHVFITDANSDNIADAGDVIRYSYAVTNTGNTTITNVQVDDSSHNGTGTFPVNPGNETLTNDVVPTSDSTDGAGATIWGTLAPGDTVTFTADYTVTQTDVDTLQ